MYEEGGVREFVERRLECGDELGGQLLDEADGVRHEHLRVRACMGARYGARHGVHGAIRSYQVWWSGAIQSDQKRSEALRSAQKRTSLPPGRESSRLVGSSVAKSKSSAYTCEGDQRRTMEL